MRRNRTTSLCKLEMNRTSNGWAWVLLKTGTKSNRQRENLHINHKGSETNIINMWERKNGTIQTLHHSSEYSQTYVQKQTHPFGLNDMHNIQNPDRQKLQSSTNIPMARKNSEMQALFPTFQATIEFILKQLHVNNHLDQQDIMHVAKELPKQLSFNICTGGKKNHAALKQFSQDPYFELKLPPPLCWAYSKITARAQSSQVLAISLSDIGCERLRRDMLNLDFAFAERSSYSLLKSQSKCK